ncbi:hypothetical protein CH337_15300, partial [Rhodoblastus acidophilus]
AAKANEAEAALAARSAEIAAHLGGHVEAFETKVVARADEAAGKIAASASEAEAALAARSAEIAARLGGHVEAFEEKVVTRADAAVGRIAAKADKVDQVLSLRSEQVSAHLGGHVGLFEDKVVNRVAEVVEKVAARADELDQSLRARAEQIADGLAGQISVFEDKTGLFEEKVIGRLGEVGEEIDRRVATLAATLEGGGRNLAEDLRQRTEALHDWYDTRGVKLVELLEERGGEVAERIAAFSQTAVGVLHERSDELIGELGRKQDEMTAAITEINSRIKKDVVGLVDAMAQSHRALLGAVDKAEGSLLRYDTQLGERLGAFTGAIDALDGEIDRLDKSARQGADSLAQSARGINAQSAGLVESLDEMRKSQAVIDEALDERLQSLQNLYNETQKRQEAFEQRLERYTAAIGKTLNDAEGKAREVGGFLTDVTSATAGALTSQFDALRDAAARERETASATLTSAYEQNMSELNHMFAQSTERYKAVAQELRGMSAEIQRELEATRQELRRGALELPRETSEQAAAMRRVVADQIKALNELTDIVARSGRALDIAEAPARIEPPRASRPAPAQAPRYDVRPPAQRPAAGGEANGWMSNLLARASQEDAPRRGKASGADLDTLSADIARMVDEAALSQAWERYRRGERGVFDRRLYTGAGAKTFEEVRRRYANEAEFRQTVDRYAQEFERLLAEVDREDRDGMLTRSYLTSETGKVYTLLAHAAGRLN